MKRILLLFVTIAAISSCADETPSSVQNYRLSSPIYPDYFGVTVPYTIAPLNFSYQVPDAEKCITTFSFGDRKIMVKGRKVKINESQWHDLLSAAKGSDITVHSSTLNLIWKIYVSPDEIDYGLNYRMIEPSYEIYSRMGIYERNLSSFKQTALIENSIDYLCYNCHSHKSGDPDNMSLHVRGPKGCTLIMKNGRLEAFNTKTDSTINACVYPFWHPEGRYIAYSTTVTHQRFHVSDKKIAEIFDEASDIVVYDTEQNQLILSDVIMDKGYAETMPSFSPDGRFLYYVRSKGSREEREKSQLEDFKYSLVRVPFDSKLGKIGEEVETLIDCDALDKSVCMPKPSPDGKYIIYSLADYGCFPTWHHESELYLLNLETMSTRRLKELNSADSETCPSFGTNSKWIVFGSRRDDGLFTRIYIAHFDSETGLCGKPFMLPQKDPEKLYSSLFFSYNIPEFVSAPMAFDKREAKRKISSTKIDFQVRNN